MEPKNPLITLVVLVNCAMNKKGTQGVIANVAARLTETPHHPHWDNVRVIENKGIAVLTSAIGYCVLEERMYGWSQQGPLCTGVGFLIDSSEDNSPLHKYMEDGK
jgi:uncharacterized protein YwbE